VPAATGAAVACAILGGVALPEQAAPVKDELEGIEHSYVSPYKKPRMTLVASPRCAHRRAAIQK
jgi:hypothetical protein